MPTEHLDVDVDDQLRAFAVALQAHAAEPIRPGRRPIDDGRRNPVVVEPTRTSPRPDRRRWLLPAVAAAVVAIVLVAGLVILSDNTTPSDTPPSTTATTTPPTTTTPEEEAEQPSPADAAVIDRFFGAYNDADTDVVLALLADDVIVTEQYGGASPNPNDDGFPNPDQQLAWKHAQGENITEPTCVVAAEQPVEGSTLRCEYATLDAFVQAVDGTPIPTRALFTIVDGEIAELHQGYGNPDYSALASQFRQWIEQNHPDVGDALFADWTSRNGAVEQGQLRAQWAQDWARSLADTDDGQAAPAPQPAVLAPQLPVPLDGETQQTIVGDIMWNRLQGDITTVPSDIAFVFDGVFYGNRLRFGQVDETEPQPQWWTSPDGAAWVAWDDAPADTPLMVVGDTLWAESSQRGPGIPPALRRWDGTGFAAVELPASDNVPGEGLTVRHAVVSVVAELGTKVVVQRNDSFGVPWDELLGIEPPLEEFVLGPWSDTFRVHAVECTELFLGRNCDVSGEHQTWRIRPDIVEGSPSRIDLYDDDTGEMISSVVPPDDGRPVDEVLDGLGFSNVGGGRTDFLVADSDGTNARPVDWPFAEAPLPNARFAELDGRLFALTGGVGGQQLELWVTADLEAWEQVALPARIDHEGWTPMASDGSTMILTTGGPNAREAWITTDGAAWSAWESSLVGNPIGAEPTEFGWIDADSADESPSIAISADAETWQVVPIPIPAALADRGLTWANKDSIDGDASIDWGWEAYAHGSTVFLVLRLESLDQARELWVGRVDTS